MKKITQKHIDKVIADLDKKSSQVIQYLLDFFSDEQPALFDYIHDADEKLNKDELDLLITAALMGWYIVRETLGCDDEVSDDFIDARLDANFDLFDRKINERAEGAEEQMDDILAYFNGQKQLMMFLISLIVERPKSFRGKIRDEALMPMALHLKTAIDCLILDEDEWGEALNVSGEYSEEDFKAMKKTINALLESYKKSALYMKLGHTEKDEAGFIISSFSEMMYNYFLRQPADWRLSPAVKCCIDIMPRKVMADDDFFKSVEPVLKSFLSFASESGAVPDGHKIAEGLSGIGTAIMERAGDPETWGPGKALLKGAAESGVDISDKKELDKYIKKYNKGLGKKHEAEKPGKKKTPGRNDPCPCGSGKKYKKCCGAE